MKKESNLIDTKDNMIKNFTKEQMEIYEYYKKQFVCADNESYPVVQNEYAADLQAVITAEDLFAE